MGPRERHARTRAKTHTIPIILGSFFGLILICGIAFAVGMAGNISRCLSDLPDYTDANAYLASEPTTILDANGNQIAMLYVQNRDSVTKDQISEYVLKGTVDVEDERFYEHHGIDFPGLVGAAKDALLRHDARGASTITQQLAKNMFRVRTNYSTGLLGYIPGVRMLIMKSKEWVIATKLEITHDKKDILTMYANPLINHLAAKTSL